MSLACSVVLDTISTIDWRPVLTVLGMVQNVLALALLYVGIERRDKKTVVKNVIRLLVFTAFCAFWICRGYDGRELLVSLLVLIVLPFVLSPILYFIIKRDNAKRQAKGSQFRREE